MVMRTRHSIGCRIWRPESLALLLHVPTGESAPGGFWQPVTGGIRASVPSYAAASKPPWPMKCSTFPRSAPPMRQIAAAVCK